MVSLVEINEKIYEIKQIKRDWSYINGRLFVWFCEVGYSKELFQINGLFFILLMKNKRAVSNPVAKCIAQTW